MWTAFILIGLLSNGLATLSQMPNSFYSAGDCNAYVAAIVKTLDAANAQRSPSKQIVMLGVCVQLPEKKS